MATPATVRRTPVRRRRGQAGTAGTTGTAGPPRPGAGGSPSRALQLLVVTVGMLTLVVAVAGLAWNGTGDTVTATTVRGDRVELYGKGLYRFATLFDVASHWAGSIVAVTLGLPLLAAGTVWARRGSMRGRLLLVGALGFFLYLSAGSALGAVAYNELFLVHVAWFAASLYAVILAVAGTDPATVRISPDTPNRWIGGFMIASGVVTAVIWLADPVGGLVTGTHPEILGPHTTLFTHALDLAVIVPTAVLAGLLILRGRPLGYVLAASLLVLEVLLLPVIAIATVVQLRLGLTFPPAVVIGPIAGFAVLAGCATVALVALLRGIDPSGYDHRVA